VGSLGFKVLGLRSKVWDLGLTASGWRGATRVMASLARGSSGAAGGRVRMAKSLPTDQG